MLNRNSHLRFAAVAVAVAAALAATVPATAQAQERKSLRWTTTQPGSYGYTIAASMAKLAEQALGGEYTVTVHPYASPTVAMKAVMDGNGEIAYTADIGMTQFHERVGGFKDYKPQAPEISHTWYSLSLIHISEPTIVPPCSASAFDLRSICTCLNSVPSALWMRCQFSQFMNPAWV